MGGVKDVLFGKAGHSTTKNVNNDLLTGSLSPALGYVTGGGNMMGNLLGVGGAPAQTDALTNFANSGGMKFLMDQMAKGVTSTKASQGLLNSGSYGTALQDRSMGLASTYLNQYMSQLMDYSKLGLGAAGVLSDSGKQESSVGSKPGLYQTLAANAGKAASAGAGG
jgi:hypothetical protein